jgi:uncharacterized membrane protein YhaH (DUF805 family)
MIEEIVPYVSLLMLVVSGVVAVVLVYSTKDMVGRNWLLASVILALISRPAFQVLSLLTLHYFDQREFIRSWYGPLNMLPLFGTACFGFFLFANWSKARMKLEMWNLLFSFSGRIPRSAFWISGCILFPLGVLLQVGLFSSKLDGVARTTIWAVCAVWSVIATWISLAIYAKRWHDLSKSGWMSLILLIPVVGVVWQVGNTGFVRGTIGPNKYGDDPLDIPGRTTNSA